MVQDVVGRKGILVFLVWAKLGRRRFLDRRARNQFPFAIDRFGQGINHCFGNVGKKSEASGHVAVESAIPYRHFGFVARAENHRTEFIRPDDEEISPNFSDKGVRKFAVILAGMFSSSTFSGRPRNGSDRVNRYESNTSEIGNVRN